MIKVILCLFCVFTASLFAAKVIYNGHFEKIGQHEIRELKFSQGQVVKFRVDGSKGIIIDVDVNHCFYGTCGSGIHRPKVYDVRQQDGKIRQFIEFELEGEL